MLPLECIIGDTGIAAGDHGLRLDMRLPWYRSLPLSTIEVEAVGIDGTGVDLAGACIEVGGKRLTLAEAGDAVDDFWFVLDSAFLVLPMVDLPAGSEHQVELTLNIYPPYIQGMKRVSKQTRNLIVGETA